MSPSAHTTREECVEAEEFRDNVVAEETGEVHSQQVRCPTSGREYEFVYDFVGLWGPKHDEYFREA